jgi:septal ring factor EnvC (AmiA/AmiB activator)
VKYGETKTLQQMKDLYKKIGDDLVTVRKDFTAAQPRIYSVLDQIDKLYNLAKDTVHRRKTVKKSLKEKIAEIKKLHSELSVLKSELGSVKQRLDTTNKQLESEKVHLSQLSKEKGDLLGKVKKLEVQRMKKREQDEALEQAKVLQSLNLTSTSAPSSPR